MPDPLQRILGLLGALLSLPLLAALAVAVRLESDGPALYVATRVGEGGRPFRCLKLRTMAWRPDADGPSLTVRDDRRVTRLGRLLRRTRLDELPQLWNVARGEMRLVGPRPEDLRFVDFGDPLHRLVFSVRPGITGLAQLLHVDEASRLGGDDPERHYLEVVLPGKLRVDAVYLRYRSTSLDLWILARTPLVLFGKRVQVPAALAVEIATAIDPEA